MTKKLADSPTPTSSGTPQTRKQPHGGALLSGGKRGHRGGGGRPSKDKLAWIAKLATSPRMKRRLRKIMRTGDDRALLQLFKTLSDRAWGAPNQRVESHVTLAELLGEGGSE